LGNRFLKIFIPYLLAIILTLIMFVKMQYLWQIYALSIVFALGILMELMQEIVQKVFGILSLILIKKGTLRV